MPVDVLTVLRSQTIRLRDTVRRPAPGAPVGDDALHAIATAVEAEGAHLRILTSDEVVDAATAADEPRRTAAIAILHGRDGRTVKVADNADPNGDGTYWATTINMANWIAARGYSH